MDMAAAVCALSSGDNSLLRWLTAVGGLLATHVLRGWPFENYYLEEFCLFEEKGQWPWRVAQQASKPHGIQHLMEQSKWQGRLLHSGLEDVQMLTQQTGLGKASWADRRGC